MFTLHLMLIGLIADTHGYLDPRITPAFEGVEAIVHAGDLGSTAILEALGETAPVYAVRGNNDDKIGGLGLPMQEDFQLAGVHFHLVHQLPQARPTPDTDVVVFGHSHRALIERRGDVLFINPGAAGRVGFHRVQTVAMMDADRGLVRDTRIVELGVRERRTAG